MSRDLPFLKPNYRPRDPRTLSLVIPEVAMGKQRARTFQKSDGSFKSVTPTKTKVAEAVIRWHWQQSQQAAFPPDTALSLYIAAYLPKPKSCPKSRLRPICKPDADNVLKLVVDALSGFAYDDDSRIVSVSIQKFYAVFPEEPRIVIMISEAAT